MKSSLALVALAAYSVMATAAPIHRQSAFLPSVNVAIAPLYEIAIDAGLNEISGGDIALLVLGVRPGKADPSDLPSPDIPSATAVFCLLTALAFSAVLVGRQLTLHRLLRRYRRKLVLRLMAQA